MKWYTLNATLFLISLFVLVSFNNDANKLIIRKWHFMELQSPALNRMINQTIDKIASLNDSIRIVENDSAKILNYIIEQEMFLSQKNMIDTILFKMKRDGWLEFKKHGKYLESLTDSKTQGTYSIIGDGKKLVTTDAGGKTDTLDIDELTETTLVLSVKYDSTKIMFAANVGEMK